MALRIDPNEIVFATGSAGATSNCILKLTNTGKQMLAFKVKTTAPNNYFVKPKAGVVIPGQSMDVAVTLQQQPADPMNINDRFLLQSAACTSQEGLTKDEWAKVDKLSISEQRLQVVFRSSASMTTPTASGEALLKGPSRLSVDASAEEMRSKFESLYQYSTSLSTQKSHLEEQLKAATRSVKSSSGGFSFLQILVIVIISIISTRFFMDYFKA